MRGFIIACFFCLAANVGIAEPLNELPAGFNSKKANQQFDQINLQLSIQNLNLTHLDSAVDTLTSLTIQADRCVEITQKKLTNIEFLIKQATNPQENNGQGADLVYLNNQQKELSDAQSQCRLFSIRAKEAIEAYKDAIAKLKQEEALTRGMPLWKTINQVMSLPQAPIFTPINPAALPWLPSPSVWMLQGLVALIAAFVVLKKIQNSRIAHKYWRFKKKLRLMQLALLSTFFLAFMVLVNALANSDGLNTASPALLVFELIFAYLSGVILLVLFFNLKKVRVFLQWYSLDKTFLQMFLIATLSFYVIAVLGNLFTALFSMDNALQSLGESLFILVLLASINYFIYYFCRAHHHITFLKKHHLFVHRLSIFLILLCAVIDILGYYHLTKHLILSGFITFVTFFVTILMTQGIQKLYLGISTNETAKNSILKYFGYRPEQSFTEFLILKTTAQIIIVAASIYLIGESWDFATDFISSLYDQILYGVHLANTTFYPTRIIAGVITFCALYLVFRAISTAISRHQQFEDEEETQVAIASILTYLGFSIAIIAGFLVAGFNFTGLAIIAGALSVGIGLGLQSIVNNFVSGIILLIEKPIRPGDRINVDGVEGFVKKIRVRSTQIITPAREDIIIPNSDLITRRVTNYMFSDKFCRINCEVGIAYGSDAEHVREVLLNVANSHDEVIKTGRNKPAVLLRSFGESSLVFQLWCLIKDVNSKSFVRSELNFHIYRAFREHNISMAFPQRDIHLTMDDWGPFSNKTQESPDPS